MPSFDAFALRTERLLLRPFREADAHALFAIFSDPRVTRYWSKPPWRSMDSAHERIAMDIERMRSGTYLRFALESAGGGRVLGECCLFNLVEQCRRAELGYALAFDAWSVGYMDEALTALLDFGFAQMALNRVEADIDPRNRASAKSLERLGFKKEGHLRERWIVEGEVSDTDLYGLLVADWQQRPKR